MVSILDFDSKSGGSNPPASANMRSYTVDSSGARLTWRYLKHG